MCTKMRIFGVCSPRHSVSLSLSLPLCVFLCVFAVIPLWRYRAQGVKAEDVKQGALGDCWLVAAMATLAGTMPGAIKKLFVNSERSFR